LLRKIGRGAFGVVWLAERQTAIATTQFALKLPRDEDIDLEAFKQEAAIWVQASGHENVVSLIEADIYDGQIVIVSEYVPDGSLTAWLKLHGGKSPSIEAACRMIDGILAGLTHLHERHIIHRDLKPDNILLRRETPRLADFGIARLLRSGSYSTNISGTLAYMAPEAFDGKRNEKTDVWSVGVIFCQLVAGHLPYAQQDTASFIGAIMRYDPPQLPESLPTALQRIVLTALQRDPLHRYKSAAAMRDDLRNFERMHWREEHKEEIARPTLNTNLEGVLQSTQSQERNSERVGFELPPTQTTLAQKSVGSEDERTRIARTGKPQRSLVDELSRAPNDLAQVMIVPAKKMRRPVRLIWVLLASSGVFAVGAIFALCLVLSSGHLIPRLPILRTAAVPITNKIGMKFIQIPAGEFMMGSTENDFEEEQPHRVIIPRSFYLGQFEVTQTQ
jgi:serine/threonine protein kinase